jgi:AcrR family transcriptional regulator
LTRERVLETALQLADQGGLAALSMRKLGQALGVEAMALYYHFANKDQVLDGIVDLVFREMELPASGADWKSAMRRRAISVRDALLLHRWAIGFMESRTNPGPATLRHHDAVIGCLRAAGFDMAMAAHAYSLLDSYIFGFAMTQMNLPFEALDDITEMAQTMLEPFPPGEYPNLSDFITEHAMQPGYDFADEFEYGLDLILDGIERARGPDARDR